ncbi:WXG100 family type VII secretion target [Paenibacillus apiarius]|uniref:WXG100 family type VII secretion target n=1 Tax=Paenibacillus apiarius TaxID=46240 RepID=A0ABT4DN39_9BACL|nr:WXG100 family type VII secretion target [Paenibacillus apiarius]MBN3522486.1 WXG100 family type VII secretion target [Paenibacillus apiarius]MCY9514661.1 WXG100 family type VII secretion target [Paenibacillus apiarius]MCY9518651.1 WXG100 family type VII secretion target [Paenibacillus apiarius]MCY9552909.1 WXG100 family type VII secretion target [Paenibacillus apiarius]MCY9556933.1 WXG100 family type VII secretion target [Paenibacillus apiarius]
MRIIVQPDALRALSRQLLIAAEQLNQIQSILSHALQSLAWETSVREAIMQQWQQAARLSSQIHAMLFELSRHVQTKADQFQTADQQTNSILGSAYGIGSATALYAGMGLAGTSLILPGAGAGIGAISNPNSAVRAMGGRGGADIGLNWKPTTAELYGYGKDGYRMLNMYRSNFNVNLRGDGYATITGARSKFALSEGIRGTRYAAGNAANHASVWKFVDPKIAAKEAFSLKGMAAKLGYAGLAYDTGTAVMTDYETGGASRAAASAVVNGSVGVGTMAASAAVGAWVGSVVPGAGTIIGAGVGLATGAVISLVSEVTINGKSLKTHAVDAVDTVIDTVTDKVSDRAKAVSDTVQDSVKAVKSGTTKTVKKIAKKVSETFGGMGKLLPG